MRRLLLSVIISLAALVWAHPAPAEEVVPVAKVNGTVLTALDLEDELDKIVPRASYHGSISPAKRIRYRPDALKSLIENELLYQEAKRLGIKVDKELIDKTRQETIERLGGKDVFKAALKQRRISDREYRKTIEKNFMVEKIIQQEIEDKSKLTDEDVAEYYEQNKHRYNVPESRRLWHILIKVEPSASEEQWEAKRKEAEGLLAQAKESTDPAKFAWEHSEGPYRVKGGDLGYIHKGQLESPLDEEAFALKKGEFSGVVRSLQGYSFFRVLDVKEPEQLALKDVADKIMKEQEEKRKKELREALIKRLKDKAEIEVYEKF